MVKLALVLRHNLSKSFLIPALQISGCPLRNASGLTLLAVSHLFMSSVSPTCLSDNTLSCIYEVYVSQIMPRIMIIAEFVALHPGLHM